MAIADLFGPWGWAALAALLAAAELVAPGIFLIWLGAAAAVTAAISALIPGLWPVQLVAFAGFATVSVILGRQVMRQAPGDGAMPPNRRADGMIGTVVTVVDAIEHGHGRVQIGDSPWPASGPDVAAGGRVRVIAVDGTTIHVEPA